MIFTAPCDGTVVIASTSQTDSGAGHKEMIRTVSSGVTVLGDYIEKYGYSDIKGVLRVTVAQVRAGDTISWPKSMNRNNIWFMLE